MSLCEYVSYEILDWPLKIFIKSKQKLVNLNGL